MTAQPPSQNKLVQLAVVGIAKDKNPYDPDAIDAAKQLREDAHAAVDGSDLRVGVTGAAAQALDSAGRLGQGRGDRRPRARSC